PANPKLTIQRFVAGQGKGSDFYAESLTRELRQEFSRIDRLDLVQVGSVWSQDVIDLPASLSRVAADYVLNGQVDADDDGVTFSVALKATKDDHVVWQQKLSRGADDLLEMERVIVDGVLAELKLNSGANRPIVQPATTNKLAYRDYLIGQDLFRRGEENNLREAIGRFDAAINKDPTFSLAAASTCRAYIELFRATRSANDFSAGKRECKRAMALDEKSAEMHLALAQLYSARGDTPTAKAEFLRALDLDPNNADANIGLADVLGKEGDTLRGEELYRRSARQNPTYWKAHNALGTYYFRQGRYHQAIESYTRVTELTAENAIAFSNLGAARLYAGDFDGALKAWTRANELDTNSASFSNLGTALYYSGKYAEALEQYQAALSIDESDHRLWGNVGDTLSQMAGRTADAADAYRKAISLARSVIDVNPNDAYTLSRLAVYYAATDDPDNARNALTQAVNLAGLDLNVLYDVSVASVLLGDTSNAQAYISKALNAGYPAVLIRSDPQLSRQKDSK
ncbi:MAG: tetratricopeptide repeat protein, partial [Pseudomonadales bacterium]|nr:tetratricopeptide repeat protein [Pseudomonadales bacterium]